MPGLPGTSCPSATVDILHRALQVELMLAKVLSALLLLVECSSASLLALVPNWLLQMKVLLLTRVWVTVPQQECPEGWDLLEKEWDLLQVEWDPPQVEWDLLQVLVLES